MERTTYKRLALVLAAALLAAPSLFAQNPAAETLQQQVPIPHAAATTPQPATSEEEDLGEIGVVQRFPKPDMFTVSTTQEVFYTTNVFYTDAAPKGSAAYLGSYDLSFVPYSTRDWTPRLTLEYNMVRYDRAAAADFDNETAILSSTYVFGEDRSWSWTAAVEASRFTAPHLNDSQFYQEIIYDNQVSHVQQLFEDCPALKDTPIFFVATYELSYHQASPDFFDRLDNAVFLGLNYSPVPSLSIGPFVRPSARNYFVTDGTAHNRADFNLSEGLEVDWTPISYLTVTADIINTNDYSNAQDQSYNTTIPGLSITGTYKF
jgi:hypothetical protein